MYRDLIVWETCNDHYYVITEEQIIQSGFCCSNEGSPCSDVLSYLNFNVVFKMLDVPGWPSDNLVVRQSCDSTLKGCLSPLEPLYWIELCGYLRTYWRSQAVKLTQVRNLALGLPNFLLSLLNPIWNTSCWKVEILAFFIELGNISFCRVW